MKFTLEQWNYLRPVVQDWWIETTAINQGLIEGRAFMPYRFTVLHEHCDELAKAFDEHQRLQYCDNLNEILEVHWGPEPTYEDTFRLATCTPKQKALALAVTLGLTEL